MLKKRDKVTATFCVVRYYEVDRMNVVHHSNYLRYFELGRCDFFAKKVVPYSVLENKYGIFSPLISANVSFYKPLRFEDNFFIITILSKFEGLRIKFEYFLFKGEERLYNGFFDDLLNDNLLNKLNFNSVDYRKYDDLICTGNTIHTFVDSITFKPKKISVYIEERGANLDNLLSQLVLSGCSSNG